MLEDIRLSVKGHVLIRDGETKEVLLDKDNSIHLENMSEALALSVGDRQSGTFFQMVFGNGASIVNGTGAITYFPPNTVGQDAALYNQTYSKVIDDINPQNAAPSTNYMRVEHVSNTTYTDVVITCFLDYNEPSGQAAFDDAANTNGDFVFDELGIKSFSGATGTSKLLTMIVFNPILKSLNRTLEIIYTIRIALS